MAKKKLDKNQIVKVPKIADPKVKLRKKPKYKSFRLHNSIKYIGEPLPSWWILLKKTYYLIKISKRQMFWFFIVYAFLTLILVRGFTSPFNMDTINETLQDFVADDLITFATGFTAFSQLLNSSNEGLSDESPIYQSILLVITSLAIIWYYRQHQAGNKVTMKLAFYRGMYPLVPFLIVIGVIGLQMLPAVMGNYIFSYMLESGLAINATEKFAWGAILASAILFTFYFLSSSLIALYIATLPEMTPLRALREAKVLVMHRRISIMLRILAFVVVIVLVLLLVVLPLIFFVPAAAEWIYFSMTILIVPAAHGYLFTLYRELL